MEGLVRNSAHPLGAIFRASFAAMRRKSPTSHTHLLQVCAAIFASGTHYIYLEEDHMACDLSALGTVGYIFASGATRAAGRLRDCIMAGAPVVMLRNTGGVTEAFAALHDAILDESYDGTLPESFRSNGGGGGGGGGGAPQRASGQTAAGGCARRGWRCGWAVWSAWRPTCRSTSHRSGRGFPIWKRAEGR